MAKEEVYAKGNKMSDTTLCRIDRERPDYVVLSNRRHVASLLDDLLPHLEAHADLAICCHDGVVRWSKALLASLSPFMTSLLADNEASDVMVVQDTTSTELQEFLCGLLANKPIECGDRQKEIHALLMPAVAGPGDLALSDSARLNGHLEGAAGSSKVRVKDEECEPALNGCTLAEMTEGFKHSSNKETLCAVETGDNVGLAPARRKHSRQDGKRRRRTAKEKASNPLSVDKRARVSKAKKSDGKSMRFFCDQCFYTANRSFRLKHHIKTAHEGLALNCDQCTFVTKSYDNLRLHINSVHQGVKYLCDRCSYETTKNCLLQRHIRTVHEGLRFACDQCSFEATRCETLRFHVKTVHEGLRLACDKCSYKSKRNDLLRLHIQVVHEGVRFPCAQCDYKATRPDNLRTHVKKQHKI